MVSAEPFRGIFSIQPDLTGNEKKTHTKQPITHVSFWVILLANELSTFPYFLLSFLVLSIAIEGIYRKGIKLMLKRDKTDILQSFFSALGPVRLVKMWGGGSDFSSTAHNTFIVVVVFGQNQ